MLLDALRSDAGGTSVEDFYFLSKTALVKHEQHLDLFDQVFGAYVAGQAAAPDDALPTLPPDWLINALQRELTDDERGTTHGYGWPGRTLAATPRFVE